MLYTILFFPRIVVPVHLCIYKGSSDQIMRLFSLFCLKYQFTCFCIFSQEYRWGHGCDWMGSSSGSGSGERAEGIIAGGLSENFIAMKTTVSFNATGTDPFDNWTAGQFGEEVQCSINFTWF